MLDSILHFLQNLSSLISLTDPMGLAVVFGLVVFADIGFVIPLVIEPTLFLITFQSGPFSEPVALFLLAMALGRQGGTAVLYWMSRLAWGRVEKLIGRFFPRFIARFSRRVQQFEEGLGRRQALALTAARLAPGLIQVSSIASGIMRLRYTYVMTGAFLAGVIYDTTIVIMGTAAHYGLQGIKPEYSIFIALGIAVLMGVITFAIGRLRKKKK